MDYSLKRPCNLQDDNILAVNRNLSHISVDLESVDNNAEEIDIQFIEDLIENFQSFNKSDEIKKNHIWKEITKPAFKLISENLNSTNNLNNILNNMFSTYLTHGFDSGKEANDACRDLENKFSANYIATVYFDKILLLAQALSIIPSYNPEQSSYKFEGCINELLRKIQSKVDFDITAPPFYGGNIGIKTDFGIHTMRTLMSIYITHSIKKEIPIDSKICEIGGGSGLQTYYLYKAGFRNISIVDLPIANLCQGYFLKRNIHDIPVFLNNQFSKTIREKSIELLSPENFYLADSSKWDVIINIDSIPEMPFKVGEKYINHIFNTNKFFISINQESQALALDGQHQLNCHEICKNFPTHVNKIRFPFWLRTGYVFEIWEPKVDSIENHIRNLENHIRNIENTKLFKLNKFVKKIKNKLIKIKTKINIFKKIF